MLHTTEHLHLPVTERPPLKVNEKNPLPPLDPSPASPSRPNTPEEVAAAFEARGYDTLEVGKSRGDPTTVAYKIYGSGSNHFVLVHGLCMPGSAWHPLIERIAHEGTPYSILVLDNRGTGVAAPLGRRTKTSTMALDVLEVLTHLGWLAPSVAAAAGAFGSTTPAAEGKPSYTPIHLLGMSMGGMISGEIATRLTCPAALAASKSVNLTHPETPCYTPRTPTPPCFLESLALVCTHDGRFPHSIAPAAGVVLMLKSNVAKNAEERTTILLKMLYSARTLSDPSEVERLTELHMKKQNVYGNAPLATFIAQTAAVTTHNIKPSRWEGLKACKVRVMCLTGDEDVLVRPSCSTILAKVTDGEEVVMRGFGHGLNTEDPGLFARIVVDHLADKLAVVEAEGEAVEKK